MGVPDTSEHRGYRSNAHIGVLGISEHRGYRRTEEPED